MRVDEPLHDPYSPRSLAQEGFVHCSFRDDAAASARLYFPPDAALRILQIDPRRRYAEVAEFVYDLHHPNGAFLERTRTPLIERSPLLFWKTASFALMLALLADLALRH